MLPYDRKFNVGRQSEQIFNEELHKMYESTKHLLDVPEDKHSVPEAKLDGSLWLDRSKNELKSYNKATNTWNIIFQKKFQIVDQITNILPPSNPVLGQLWLYNDVLMYFNGSEWKPVKALEQDGSQFNLSIFENFLLVSPLLTREDIISNDDISEDIDEEYLDEVGRTILRINKWKIFSDSLDNLIIKYENRIINQFNKKLSSQIDDEQLVIIKPLGDCITLNEWKIFSDSLDNLIITFNDILVAEWVVDKNLIEAYIIANNLSTEVDNDNEIVNDVSIGNWSFNFNSEDNNLYLRYRGVDVSCWSKDGYYPGVPNYSKLTAAKADTLLDQYLQGKIDYDNNSKYMETGWTPDVMPTMEEIDPRRLYLYGDTKILVPNIDVDRIFLNESLDFSYKEITKICISYLSQTLNIKKPSLIHINPGKLTKIKKRLFKIDKESSKIYTTAYQTEFYGFHGDSIYGDLLLPEYEKDDGGYIKMSDGIILSYQQSQNYDYVLAISYEFSWFKSTGTLNKVSNNDETSSYYIQDYAGPITVFTDGFNLEETSFTEDNISKTITINENTDNIDDVSMIHAIKREYGFVRKVDIQKRAIIKVLTPYKKPLIYLNGEAIHPQLNDVEIDGNYIYVKNGLINMTWAIVELFDPINNYDMNLDTGYVNKTDAYGIPIITFDNTKVDEGDGLILYIDGLLIKKEDLNINYAEGFINVDGLSIGQDYILLRDKYNYFYDESKLTPALPVGHLSESLVYINGHLINNATIIDTIYSKEQIKPQALQNEIKCFLDINGNRIEYCYYDDPTDAWLPLNTKEIKEVQTFSYSYENTVRSVKFNVPISKDDDIRTFAFNYANAIGETLVIRNLPSISNIDDTPYVENQKVFNIKDSYIPNIGSLSVWVNGIRQYDVIEFLDGTGFELPKPVTGVVTYVIERPEKGVTTVATREILSEKNIVPNTINVYKTTKPLYPGRVLFYINGIRQSQDAFTILDNYTFLVNDKNNMLIGNPNNYPIESVLNEHGQVVQVKHSMADKILIEVKQDVDRRENFIKLDADTISDISISKYELPIEILEPNDEIMIFIDGLFVGLRRSFGYEVDKNRGVISLGVRRDIEDPTNNKTEITNIDVIDRIINDPLYTYFEGNPDKKLEYENKHGKPYEKKTRNILFDWR